MIKNVSSDCQMSNVILLEKTCFHKLRAPSAYIDFTALKISLFFCLGLDFTFGGPTLTFLFLN